MGFLIRAAPRGRLPRMRRAGFFLRRIFSRGVNAPVLARAAPFCALAALLMARLWGRIRGGSGTLEAAGERP